MAETLPVRPGPEVEVIDDKIFSVRHTNGLLLATVAYSDFEIEALSQLMRHHHPQKLDPYIHDYGSITFLVTDRGLEFYTEKNPFRTDSPGAETVYAIIGRFEDCIFMGQNVGVKARSSWHEHVPGEHFFNRDGNAFKYENEGRVSRLGTHTYVPANELHMIYTLDKPAINLILHEGTDLNHNSVKDKPRPSNEELRELTVRAGLYQPA